MAEIIVNKVYSEDYIASSAGISTSEPKPMCYDARAALVRAGYSESDFFGKASRRLTDSLMEESDIVIGITAEHADAIKKRFPKYSGKVCAVPQNVHAPTAGDSEGYDRCFCALCANIEKLLYPEGSKWRSRS